MRRFKPLLASDSVQRLRTSDSIPSKRMGQTRTDRGGETDSESDLGGEEKAAEIRLGATEIAMKLPGFGFW